MYYLHHMTVQEYYQHLESTLTSQGHPDTAIQQAKYMKNRFEFIGMKAKVWMGHLRKFYKEFGYPEDSALREFTELCYASPYREIHYCCLETVQRRLKYMQKDFIDQLEWLIVTNSWWDTVDWLSGLVGKHLQSYPDLQPQTTHRFNTSDNMWLIRVSIIFQLKYKEDVDFELMKSYILAHWDSKEFFIRKAQGWALRQYSKFNPEAVRKFLDDHPELSGLTHREGRKYL